MPAKMENFNQSFQKFLANRSKDYNAYGRYLVKDCTKEDLGIRFISFVGDLSASILPIILWDYLFLLVGSGFLSYPIFRFITSIISIVLIVSILFVNGFSSVLFKGQTFGKVALNFKVVNEKDNHECDNKTLLLRQLIGFGIPMVVLTWLLGVLGSSIFIVLNGVYVIVDKQHRSIIDRFLHTKVVKLNAKAMKHGFEMEEKAKEKEVVLAENKYDLHVYSSFSHDGEVQVEDLFKKAKAKGIQALSICDHNCVKANNIAEKLAPLYDITYIPGINIDCMYEGYHVRILGYYINSNDERFMQVEYENLAKEKAVSMRRVDLFEQFTGFAINQEKLLASNRFQIISPEMIARYILSKGEYHDHALIKPYISGSKKERPITNFVKDFFGKGGPAYVPVVHPDARDMIALIKANGGIPVLAHPMHSLRDDVEVLEKLLDEGIEGIELFTPYHSKTDMKYLISVAKRHHLATTAGSEYHGSKKPKFILGKTYCPKDAEEVIYRFIQKYGNK